MTRLRQETGTVSTELTIVMPVVLTLVLLAVQFGLWLFARQVVAAAAQDGVAAAQMEGASADIGQSRAAALLAASGGVRDPVVESERTSTVARVSVRATAPTVVPWMSLPVSSVAEGPVERFLPEPQR